MFVSLCLPVHDVNNLQCFFGAYKKVDYKRKYFLLTPHVGCAHKEAKCIVSNDK